MDNRDGVSLRHRIAGVPRLQPMVQWMRTRTSRQWLSILLSVLGAGVSLGVLTVGILWITLPDLSDPATIFAAQSTVIVDRKGIELYRLFSEQDRTYVPRADISPLVQQATIAIEDERFLSRSGCVDIIGFTRAALSQVVPGLLVRSGGSTLTQQFAKNALVGSERSIIRKIRELMLACRLERQYTKDELLELYLNWIPYGQNAYGVEQAAKTYFGISAKDLSLAQAVVLAALPQRPSYLNPYGPNVRTRLRDEAAAAFARGEIRSERDLDDDDLRIGLLGQTFGTGASAIRVGGRTDQVLQNMEAQGMITASQHADALAELATMTFSRARQTIRAPHFVLDIERQAARLLGLEGAEAGVLEQGGFRIETTLDWDMQQAAERVVATRRDTIAELFEAHNIALVALDPATRDILAYVGNADFGDDEHEGKIDMVTRPRQPGSSFKAITYLAAFEAGYGPGSVLYDVPTRFGDDEPQNYDGTFWGPVTVRRALGGSRNIPAIKAFFLGGGEGPLLSLASKLGVTTPSSAKAIARATNPDFEYGWPLAIGAAETPLLEMVQGYATIASGGEYRPVRSIQRITDRDGVLRYVAEDTPPSQVVDARLTAMITSILSDRSARPQEFWQEILSVPGTEAAAKTGTSNKCLERDANGACKLRRPESLWTIGYTPGLVAGVWAGNATSQSLSEKADGLTVAAPIWQEFLRAAIRLEPERGGTFSLPEGLARPLLSGLSGDLASSCTPPDWRRSDVLPKERVPTTEDTACIRLRVDRVTGLLASDVCPADATEAQSFFAPRSELPARWPLWEEAVQTWAAEQMALYRATPDHSGSLLPLPLAPTTVCDPSLTPGRFDPLVVRIVSPEDGGVVSYPAFVPEVSVETTAPIRAVQLFVDDKPLRTLTEAPFRGSLRVPRTIDRAGVHTLRAEVTDAYYKTAMTEVRFRFE